MTTTIQHDCHRYIKEYFETTVLTLSFEFREIIMRYKSVHTRWCYDEQREKSSNACTRKALFRFYMLSASLLELFSTKGSWFWAQKTVVCWKKGLSGACKFVSKTVASYPGCWTHTNKQATQTPLPFLYSLFARQVTLFWASSLVYCSYIIL